MLNFENDTTHYWKGPSNSNFVSIRKKKKASYKVTYYRAQTHAAVWRLKKKKTSYLANPFRLNITLLNYVTYIVISIRKKIIHRNQWLQETFKTPKTNCEEETQLLITPLTHQGQDKNTSSMAPFYIPKQRIKYWCIHICIHIQAIYTYRIQIRKKNSGGSCL